MSGSLINTPRSRPKRLDNLALVIVGALLLAILVALILPAIQTAGSRPMPPTRKNLRQIAHALDNYADAHGFFPFDPRGPEFALYLLADAVPASCFDARPYSKPKPEARWDHDAKRLVESDFEYLNWPGLNHFSNRIIVLAEKPDPAGDTILLLRCDHLVTWCKRPPGSSRDLLGNWQTFDDFLIKDPKVWQEWEAVPLPQGPSTSSGSSISGGKTEHRGFGRIDVYYDYEQDRLKRRTFSAREGRIVDTVETDELGRITAVYRSPDDWKKFWPVKVE